jgi:putative ubiquitin-RnfH superfamily antitoxin RatB of RatAB toxin-antitoxin module
VRQLPLVLPAGSTVADAVQAAAPAWLADGLPAEGWVAARWGRKLGPDSVLVAGDRIELCRGLQVDPKEARRLRYQAQGPRRRQPTRGARRATAALPEGSAATADIEADQAPGS